MVELQNLNKVKFQLDERSKMRATIGLNGGMALGMLAAFIAIVLSAMTLWYKIFAAFGVFCAVILQVAGVIGSVQRLKAYNKAVADFNAISPTSQGGTPYIG